MIFLYVHQQVLETCLQNAQHGGPLAGSCFWMLSSLSYPDYDGFALYYNQPLPQTLAPGGSTRLDPSAHAIPELHGWTEGEDRSSRGGGLYDAPYPPSYNFPVPSLLRSNSVVPEALPRSSSGVYLDESSTHGVGDAYTRGSLERAQSPHFTAIVPNPVSTSLSAGKTGYAKSNGDARLDVSMRGTASVPKASWLPNGSSAGLSFGVVTSPDSSAHGGGPSSLYRVRGDSVLNPITSGSHTADSNVASPDSTVSAATSSAFASTIHVQPGSKSSLDGVNSTQPANTASTLVVAVPLPPPQQQPAVAAARALLSKLGSSDLSSSDGRPRVHLSPSGSGSLPRQSSTHRDLAFTSTASTRGLDPTLRVISIYARKMTNLAAEVESPAGHQAGVRASLDVGDLERPSQFLSFMRRSFSRPSIETDWERRRREKMGVGTALAGHHTCELPEAATPSTGPKSSCILQ